MEVIQIAVVMTIDRMLPLQPNQFFYLFFSSSLFQSFYFYKSILFNFRVISFLHLLLSSVQISIGVIIFENFNLFLVLFRMAKFNVYILLSNKRELYDWLTDTFKNFEHFDKFSPPHHHILSLYNLPWTPHPTHSKRQQNSDLTKSIC